MKENKEPGARLEQTPEDPRWRRIYAAVIFFAVAVMLLLWLFQRAFTP